MSASLGAGRRGRIAMRISWRVPPLVIRTKRAHIPTVNVGFGRISRVLEAPRIWLEFFKRRCWPRTSSLMRLSRSYQRPVVLFTSCYYSRSIKDQLTTGSTWIAVPYPRKSHEPYTGPSPDHELWRTAEASVDIRPRLRNMRAAMRSVYGAEYAGRYAVRIPGRICGPLCGP